MKTLDERVKDRIRETICQACMHRTAKAGCSLGGEQECAIMSRSDKIIEIVRSIQDPSIEPYVERLREIICNECRMQDPRGHCRMRDHADCALDDYFVLLVDQVEQELDLERSRKPA